MSINYPRHVRDLPKLELESEDELSTPHKSHIKNKDLHEELEIDNYGEYQSNHGSTNSFNSFRMLPKRRAELPTLESDSEDDDIVENDNLNCAILNDSFLISPGKSDREDGSSKESSAIKTNFNNSGNDKSFQDHFSNLDIKNPPKVNIQHTKKEPTVNINEKRKEIDSRMDLLYQSKNNSSLDTQFATPQIRSFSVQRRRNDLCSTQSQKSKSAIVNEFRTQKVLFQTPMAILRAPIMQNDSISLSLCDTMNECVISPTAEKSTKCEDGVHTSNSPGLKTSLEGAFSESSKEIKENQLANMRPENKTVLYINQTSYSIIKKLGCGGSSSVYLAKRLNDGEECALKVVDLQGDPAVVEGYLNETKLLAKLQGNICVVSLHEYQLLQKESKLLLVMEKGDSDLHKILQSYTTNLPLYVLTNFLYQMLQAVNYIHQNGVIHSDLKPANFLMVNGRLKLIDFGIASNIAIDSTSIIKFSQAGTFNYISPEALTDTSSGSSPIRSSQPKIKISTKSDVWSLGCILYLLLYQKTPFGHIKNIYNKISAICSPTQAIDYGPLPPYYPSMLVQMVKHCLQHNPKHRLSCAELLNYPFDMIIPLQNLSLPIAK